ncbi:MAG: TonB-dependent receptor domain-containing protein [Janthinobacterium lividum]
MNKTRGGRFQGLRRDLRVLLLTGTTSLLAIATSAQAQTTAAPAPADASQPAADASKETPQSTEQTPQITTPAPSQPSQAQAPGQEIVVTGSRIARRDYTATSPIVTANQALLTQSSTSAIEQNLNKLPQFTPVQTPTQGGDIQPTSTNTPGAATLSLRGLGVNRTLVLLDGKRATPSNANMVVDINTIPQALIERVEVITGGASAVYGADAVAGVVNFVLKKNFSGFQADASTSLTQEGDGLEYNFSGLMGTNFDDNRGNITIAFQNDNRAGSLRRDRSFFRKFDTNPTTGGTEFFSDFPNFAPGANQPSQAAINAVFAGRNTTVTPNYPTQASVYFNPGNGTNNTAFGGFDGLSIPGAYAFSQPLGTKYALESTGQLKQNFQDDLATFPLSRWNIYARGNYELNDNISVFMQGNFNRSHSFTVQQPSPAANGWSATIPLDGRPIPTALATLLASRPNPLAPYQLNVYLNYADRTDSSDVFNYQILTGLDGKLPGTDWTWEVYGSQGQSRTNSYLTGFQSLSRYRTIITAPNWGAGFTQQGNAQQGGFGAATATCTSGLNPFDNVPVSADCQAAIGANISTISDMRQTVVEGTATGSLFALPAGNVRAAVGADYRNNRFFFRNDNLTTQGESFQDQAIGLYPSGNSQGSIDVKEIYGELLVPVVKDLPFAKAIDLDLGIRYSDYNTTGGSVTWKASADWKVNNWLTFRGGYNQAERAPNVAELFQARQQVFAVAGGGDVCSTNNPLPYSAGAANTTNRAQVRALCATLMNQIDPTTSANFYGNPANQGAGAAFVFVSSQGNPDLKPEKAKTFTVGSVLSSPSDNAWFSGVRLSADYYNIKVSDAIGLETGDVIQQECFDTRFNPTLSATSAQCQAITRNVSIGSIGNLLGTYLNSGRFHTSGIDAQFDWAVNLRDAGTGLPGSVSLNVVGNYLNSYKSAPLEVLAEQEYAGTFGPSNENGLQSGQYRWKTFTSLTYGVGPATLTLQWQHLPSIKPVEAVLNPTSTFVGAPAYDVFNLSGTYAITPDVVIRAGIENLANITPPIYEYNSAPPAGTIAGGSIGGSGSQGSFYDVLGRRFYIGVKAKF